MGVEITDRRPVYGDEANSGNSILGYESTPRWAITSNGDAIGAGVIRWAYFTATRAVTCTNFFTRSGGTAASATPTLCRVGLYTVASNGDLKLVARTANTTSLWASTDTDYTTAMATAGGYPASYTPVPGQRYAIAVLCVTAGTAPTWYTSGLVGHTKDPRMSAALTGQTDLPASVDVGSLLSSGAAYYMAMIP